MYNTELMFKNGCKDSALRYIYIAFTLFFLCFPVSLFAQQANVSVSVKNVTLKQLLTEIEKKSDIRFSYLDETVNPHKNITVAAENEPVVSILNKILPSRNLEYVQTGNNIAIKSKPQGSNRSKKVKGVVVDATKEPIIGANVVIKGTSTGLITDLDGQFEIEIPDNGVLQVSYIGFTMQEIPVSGKDFVSVLLKEDSQALDEVVVVGYGSVKKSNLTGALSSVKMDDVPQVATASVANLLSGRVSGLSIRQNTAAPGDDFKMVIRGSASTNAGNDPLYVIDGFPGGSISAVNPADIESVEVLKDASATAIYGARAANGVILVNTKKGKKGAMNVQLKVNTSVQTISNPYDMMGSKDYMMQSNSFFKEKWLYDNKIAPYGNVDPSTLKPDNKPKVAFSPEKIAAATDVTDWFDEISRTGFVNDESISINGGADNVRYLFSLGHFGQRGVIINTGMEKYTGRLNLELDLSKRITTGISITGGQTILDRVTQAGDMNNNGMIRDALMYPQYLPVYDEDGNYAINPDHNSTPNPVSWKDVENKTNTFRVLANNFWNVNLMKGLDFRMSWGVNSSFAKTSTFYPKTHLLGARVNTTASIKEQRNNDYLLDATLTYQKTLAKGHDLKVMAGYAYQKFLSEYVSAENSDFITDIYGPNNLGAGGNLTKKVGSEKKITKYLSYFGRINYDIGDKYLFTFTIRADGSDKFGKENRFGYFPSGAFAWRVSEENFMKNQKIISNLKFRASLGQTGNAQIDDSTYGFYVTGANYVLGNKLITGVSENQLPNPRLKWETTTEFNIGLDWGIFNNRLTGTFEYYRKTVSDLLDKRLVGSYYPVKEVADNLGKTQSTGFEIQLSSKNIQTKDFNWSTDLNLYQYKDSWKERNPFTVLAIYQDAKAPMHIEYGYLSDGLIKEGETVSYMPGAPAGSIKIKDINGWLKDADGNFILDENGKKQLSGKPDDTIDDADKTIIRSSVPKLSFGLGNTLRYKDFDFGFFFYGELGRELNNTTRQTFLQSDRINFGDNMTTDAFDRWTSTNTTGKYPSGLYTKYDSSTDFWIEKADFLRLKNITLGYTLPARYAKGIFKRARFYLDAQNLFVLTNYTGSDPETDGFSAYPNQRTYSFGVELTF